jgi:hypothetical protein
MTHTSTEQPEALRLADALRDGKYSLYQERNATEAELRRLHARVQELEFRRDIASACFRNISTASQAQRVPLSDAECDSLIAALCPDFCDERFPGDRSILRQLARDALNPNVGITAIDSRITQVNQV